MNVPPLCIIQARYHSTRLPGKMCLPLPCLDGQETLIARAWRIACEAFGEGNCVVALPMRDSPGPLVNELTRIRARWDATHPEENDVLGRLHRVAHSHRWHPESVIVRYTPDDWNKDRRSLRLVAFSGLRLPVEQGGEAFTLSMLDEACGRLMDGRELDYKHEHITYALFDTEPPRAPGRELPWSIDTREDYEAVKRHLEAA